MCFCYPWLVVCINDTSELLLELWSHCRNLCSLMSSVSPSVSSPCDSQSVCQSGTSEPQKHAERLLTVLMVASCLSTTGTGKGEVNQGVI